MFIFRQNICKLKLGFNLKKPAVILIWTKQTEVCLNILLMYGFITFFKKQNKLLFVYFAGQKKAKKIYTFNKSTAKTIIQYRSLNKLTRWDRSLYVLSTIRGLAVSFTALKNTSGGEILLKLVV